MPLIDFLKSLWYNTLMNHNVEVYTLEYNYGFLFKKSALSKADLKSLLFNKEFVSELNALMDKGQGVEDTDIYNIVKKVYFPRLKANERSGEARHLNKAIRNFAKILFDDEFAWQKEYEEDFK